MPLPNRLFLSFTAGPYTAANIFWQAHCCWSSSRWFAAFRYDVYVLCKHRWQWRFCNCFSGKQVICIRATYRAWFAVWSCGWRAPNSFHHHAAQVHQFEMPFVFRFPVFIQVHRRFIFRYQFFEVDGKWSQDACLKTVLFPGANHRRDFWVTKRFHGQWNLKIIHIVWSTVPAAVLPAGGDRVYGGFSNLLCKKHNHGFSAPGSGMAAQASFQFAVSQNYQLPGGERPGQQVFFPKFSLLLISFQNVSLPGSCLMRVKCGGRFGASYSVPVHAFYAACFAVLLPLFKVYPSNLS